jgi:hypothetical protein
MAKEDLAGDQSWVQDEASQAKQPAAAGASTASGSSGGGRPARRTAPSGPLTKEEREALLATRTQEVSQMLKGVSAQLTDIQNEAARSVGKIAESAHLLAATAGQRAMQMLAVPALMGLKLALFPLSVTQRLLARFAPPREYDEAEDDLPDWDEETGEKAAPEQLGTFNDMLELNIIFMDNQRVPMYSMAQTRGTGRLGKLEEQFIMDNAMQAIRECAEFTNDLPTPTTGTYANEPIRAIMEGVQALDVGRFMAFVKAFPGKYIGKQWKVSETFATWLLNNAPGAKG